MGRAPCCDKNKVKRGPWSPQEDEILKNYLHCHGTATNWIALPQKAGLKRCGKSCRLRWLNYLRPDIKHGSFTPEEDHIIVDLYSKLGSRWSFIASQLQGRTDNDVKNRWNTKLKKYLLATKESHYNSNNTTSQDSFSTTLAANLVPKSEFYDPRIPILQNHDSLQTMPSNVNAMEYGQILNYNPPESSSSSDLLQIPMDNNYGISNDFGVEFIDDVINNWNNEYQIMFEEAVNVPINFYENLGVWQNVNNQFYGN